MSNKGSNRILVKPEWDYYYVKVPALKIEGWDIEEKHGVVEVFLEDGKYFIPRHGAGMLKLTRKVDIVKLVDGHTPLKLGETQTTRVVMFGDFGIRIINADDDVDGLEDTTVKNLTEPALFGVHMKTITVEKVSNNAGDGSEDTTNKNSTKTALDGMHMKTVVIENAIHDPDHVDVIEKDFEVEWRGEKLIIGPSM